MSDSLEAPRVPSPVPSPSFGITKNVAGVWKQTSLLTWKNWTIIVAKDFQADELGVIPKCKPHLQTTCIEFGYICNDEALPIIEKIAEISGLDITKQKRFNDTESADNFIYENLNVTQGVYHMNVLNTTNGLRVEYDIMLNYTKSFVRKDPVYPIKTFLLPMQNAAEKSILWWAADRDVDYEISIAPLPHPALKPLSVIFEAGPSFFFGALCFNAVIQLGQIVMEKENGLREALRVHDSSYWISYFITNSLTNIVSTTILILSGLLFQFDFFYKNSAGVYCVLFYAFGLCMVPMTLFVSVFVNKATTASSVGFFLYLVGAMGQGFARFLYDPNMEWYYTYPPSLLPFILLAKGMMDLSDASNNELAPGMHWEDVNDGYWPMMKTFEYMGISFVLFTILALYADNVVPNPAGLRKPWYYPLQPSYWRQSPLKKVNKKKRRKNKTINSEVTESTSLLSNEIASTPMSPIDESLDIDVVEEAKKVQMADPEVSSAAIVVSDLTKTFTKSKGCCGTTSFTAVNHTNFFVQPSSLLCLLGHNGAGKTTTINMLTGRFLPTEGDAWLFGYSVTHQVDQLRSFIGVCPQHDILFDQLTAAEHIELYAGLRGMNHHDVADEVRDRLSDVRLLSVRDVLAGAYSGGMKRRLSVAISLVANPKIVFLDEPTTGMDPISRRQVWEFLSRAKEGRVIILTTHSMTEASLLSDKIIIMSEGQFSAVGSGLHLKNRFGSGYTIKVVTDQCDDVLAYCTKELSWLNVVSSGKDRVVFTASPSDTSQLSSALDQLRTLETVQDVQISMATLEDVFLRLAHSTEV